MRGIARGGIVVLLMTVSGFAETIITAQDYAVDSDVVLESAVKEIKSVPRDTVNVVGDSVKYVADEAAAAANGVKAAFAGASAQDKASADGALAVANGWTASNDILFRSYEVSDEIGKLLLTGSAGGDGSSLDVHGFFKSVTFPEKTSAYYLPEFHSLFVRQTLDNILAMEKILASYQNEQRKLTGYQVEIETKFVEVSQNTLNELGFSWVFNGKGSNGTGDLKLMDNLYLPAGQSLLAGGLRTSAQALNSGVGAGVVQVAKTAGSLQWEMYISALEQAKDSNVLCSPRVVARDGSTAVIQVGDEQMIPKAFDVNNSDVSPYVEHTDWDLELMGVHMEVTPNLRDGGLIDLELHPKIMDVVGYDSYQVLPAYSGGCTHRTRAPIVGTGIITAYTLSGDAIVNTVDEPLEASLPYLRIRELETEVTVADGSTIGMGGLIYDKLETFRDKVPVLGSIPLIGRLFRSEGERNVKRNLMIFVTATQVDLDGRRSADVALNR